MIDQDNWCPNCNLPSLVTTEIGVYALNDEGVATLAPTAVTLCSDCGQRPLTCFDCPLIYGGPGWCDVVIPDADWLAISPNGDEGGVLCFTCIARRLIAAGRSQVPMLVVSGPFVHHPEPLTATPEPPHNTSSAAGGTE